MRPRGTIRTTATFTGSPAPGLQRRPVWDNSTTVFIAQELYNHHCRACAIAAEATGTWRNDYRICFSASRPKWVPCVLADAYCKIMQIAAKRKLSRTCRQIPTSSRTDKTNALGRATLATPSLLRRARASSTGSRIRCPHSGTTLPLGSASAKNATPAAGLP